MKKVIVTSAWGAGYLEGGGMQWLNLHYLAGLRALGFEPFWLDVLGPSKKGAQRSLDEMVDGFRAQCEEFGFGENWAVLYDNREVFGMTEGLLHSLCGDAVLLINLCGSLKNDELLRRIQRRAYFDLDPGFTQIWAHEWDMDLSKHNLFFTVGLNIGQHDFVIPLRGIEWQPVMPPVALEYWPVQTDTNAANFTTVGQWRGQYAVWKDEVYGPKNGEFLKFIELPRRTPQPIELALLIHETETDDLAALRKNNWQLVNPHEAANGRDGFRSYVQRSRAEFSVAKHGYVKSQSGWLSDRTVCYLASGRPALVQDTGFGKHFPIGKGLLTFTTLEEAAQGIESINADYAAHSAAARKLAEEKLAAPKVLQSILERAGVR
ncbi:MAG TPA: hypothetical protein VNL17_10725 [Verrucomicrobiae bacterium]|nr:hypothetical protein [Verrucomicrobiae bacterium]